jgi:tyrosyl-tRNA synthetase
MQSLKSPFLKDLQDRGLIHQCTDIEQLDELTTAKSIPIYIGFDATAPSLHVGNLMGIMILRIAQRHGHKPIVILGGGTTKIGDPTFKDTLRPLLDESVINKNIETIRGVFSKYINFDKALMLNNEEWLSPLNYMDFLRDYGRHFSVNRMLTFDSVKMRLERDQSFSFIELNYMILQAYDFLELNRRYGCLLQCGGSDQWGNIVNGVELTRRSIQKEVFGLTSPLLTTSSGAKMGKTVSGAVWLNTESLSPFDYWQFWRNVDDADALKFMKIYTDLPVAEIESRKDQNINQLKILLADEATKLAHGEDVLEAIHASVKGESNSALPVTEIPMEEFEEGVPVISLLTRSGLCASNGDARRLIRGGGCLLNGEKITDENFLLPKTILNEENSLRLSSGKKKHVLIQAVKNIRK